MNFNPPTEKLVNKGGRPKGATNLATRDLKALAAPYGPMCVKALVELVKQKENPNVRVVAAKELLDRGYGKPVQVNANYNQGESMHKVIIEFVKAGGQVDVRGDEERKET